MLWQWGRAPGIATREDERPGLSWRRGTQTDKPTRRYPVGLIPEQLSWSRPVTTHTTTVRHRATARELASLRRRETAFGHRARARADARARARQEAAERIAERIAGHALGLVAHIKKSMVVEEADAGGFHNGFCCGPTEGQNAGFDAFDAFDNAIEAEGNWINFRFFDRRGAPTAAEARWMLTSSEREQIRRERVLRRASASTPARRCATPVRRARARRSHRVVRVAKTAGGDSGDPDPEPEPPTTRHTATIGGVP